MPKNVDLMGLGMPGPLAGSLGNTPTTLTCAGTTQATAATIPNGLHLFVCAATGAANGAIFSTAAPLGSPYYFTVGTGSSYATATLYCQVGGFMNTATNGSVSLATGKSCAIIQYATNSWFSIPTSP